jgi:hypothetical protein
MQTASNQSTQSNHSKSQPRFPLLLKAAFTAFMAVLVPVYWSNYGPTNFLYFCDIALFITLIALWTESALLTSIASVGIIIPQLFWCVDFGFELCGSHLSHMTSYMFDSSRPLFLRGLSLFHGWLPLTLLFMLKRSGYDKRALRLWTGLSVVLCLVAFYFLPGAGAVLDNPNIPRNVNYVFGLDDAAPQTMMSPGLYLLSWLGVLFGVLYLPAHIALKRLFPVPAA